jgi:hypothetical protein
MIIYAFFPAVKFFLGFFSKLFNFAELLCESCVVFLQLFGNVFFKLLTAQNCPQFCMSLPALKTPKKALPNSSYKDFWQKAGKTLTRV